MDRATGIVTLRKNELDDADAQIAAPTGGLGERIIAGPLLPFSGGARTGKERHLQPFRGGVENIFHADPFAARLLRLPVSVITARRPGLWSCGARCVRKDSSV